MPMYAKFMKDILTKKGKYIDNESIVVEGNYNIAIKRILPQKFKDPESVTIPCSIGMTSVGKALIDLGSSINLVPLCICRRLGNLKVVKTKMTLLLENCSITQPYSVVEDVLVKVKQSTFSMDFVIMDIKEDTHILIILGQPFMLTTNCVVNMGNDNMEMSVKDQKVSFNLIDSATPTSIDNICFGQGTIDS